MGITDDRTDPDLRMIESSGMQKKYLVLSDVERAKGFVRPVRRTYVHVRPAPQYGLRDLTTDEQRRYSQYDYVKYEPYPDGSPACGKFWTQSQLSPCGVATTMGQALAETYARDPKFYGATYCVGCKAHFPVGKNGEFRWDDGEMVGT